MALDETRFLEKINKTVEDNQEPKESLLEVILKPKYEIPGLSAYSRAVGRLSEILDAPIEKEREQFAERYGISKEDVPSAVGGTSLGMILGQPALSSIQITPGDIPPILAPASGDPETGKYSPFDIAFSIADIIPATKVGKSAFKSLTKPTKKKFEKNIQKALKKGGKENLEAAKQWQKEWITDPETFVRQKKGDELIDIPSSEKFVKLARKPNMSRSRMKKEGLAVEWDAYVKYKDEMTEEFDRLELHEKLPWVKKGDEWKRLPDETMEQWRHRVKFESDPWYLGPGEVNPSKEAEKVKYGFGLPEDEYAGVYRPGYDVTDINEAIKRRVHPERMGSYHEMVEVNPAIKIKHYETTAVHELQHFITKGNENIPDVVSDAIRALRYGDMDELARVWKQKKLSVLKDGDPSKGLVKAKGATAKEIKGTVEYFGKRTEIQARLQQLRHSLGVKPGQKVTKKMLILSTKSKRKDFYRDLVNVLGEENVIKALNTLPAIVPMTTEQNLFNQWDKEDNLF